MASDAHSTPIGDLIVPGRTYHCLLLEGFWTVGDVLQVAEDDWYKFCWAGTTATDQIKEALAAIGLRLPEESAPWVAGTRALSHTERRLHFRRVMQERNGSSARDLHRARYGCA